MNRILINLLVLSCLVLISSSAYDIQFAYPKNTQAIAGTMPDKKAKHLNNTWVWSSNCFGASSKINPFASDMGCYWYAKTDLVDQEWVQENDMKYMFNATRNSTYKYLHVHIHDQGESADSQFLPSLDLHKEMQEALTDGDLITILPVSYYQGANNQLKWGDWTDLLGNKCLNTSDVTESCSLQYTSGNKQDELRKVMINMIEQLRTVSFPSILYKQSIISGYGIGAAVAADIALGHYYNRLSPFGSIVLIDHGLTPGSLTARRLHQSAASTYNVEPLVKYNVTFEQVSRPYMRLNMIGGNASVFYNKDNVPKAWDQYCQNMTLDCANFIQLNCSHFDLMNQSNPNCGYSTFKNILVSEMKVVAKVRPQVDVDGETNELNEAITSTWTLILASLILMSGQVGFTLLELSQTSKKNREFTIQKNVMVFIVAFLSWFAMGYAVAFGTDAEQPNPSFIGFRHGWFADFTGGLSTTGDKAVKQSELDENLMFNQRRFFVFFTFVIFSANIATSSIAERTQFKALIGWVILQQAFVVPFILCWTMASEFNGVQYNNYGETIALGGFLYDLGYFDRIGAVPILYSGALVSLVAAAVVGPRYGIFMPIEDQERVAGGGNKDKQKGLMTLLKVKQEEAIEIDELYLYKIRKLIKRELIQNNQESGVDLQQLTLGTLLMGACLAMMNSLGLNSQFDLFSQYTRYNANYGLINTLLAGSISGLISYFGKQCVTKSHISKHMFKIRALCNGFLAGAVGVSVGSASMQPFAALITGIISGPLYIISCKMFQLLQIDDPLENIAIYLTPVLWSTINSSLFMDPEGILIPAKESIGPVLFGIQVLTFTIVTAIITIFSWIYFFFIHKMGWLKVEKSVEVLGRDAVMNSMGKDIDLTQLLEKIRQLFPEPKKTGC